LAEPVGELEDKMVKKGPKERRKTKVRTKIKSLGQGRKLTVYRSNKYLWAQIVDIPSGQTLVSANGKNLIKDKPELKKETKTKRAFQLGKKIGQKAVEKGIKKVAFDRGHYRFHGRVKALAEGARQGGLKL